MARAAPFDQPAQTLMCAAWGLPPPARSGLVGYLDPPAATAAWRLVGVRRQLQRLTTRCGPPAALRAALDLVAAQPAATEPELRRALAAAGLSTGSAGPLLLLGLARLWRLSLPEALDPPTDARIELAKLIEQVRAAGVLTAPPVPAGQAPLLRAAGVQDTGEWLVAVDDRSSQVARPVRRQLAAVGPLTADVLADGGRRERPSLAGLCGRALLAWAQAQPDLTVAGDVITLTGGSERWLRGTDPCVLALFAAATVDVPRSAILTALVEHGSALPSAEVWLVRCSWLRRTPHARGRYSLAPSPQ